MVNAIKDSPFYLTRQGLQKVQEDYKHLCNLRKSMVADGVPSVWASEELNPEYIAFREDLGLFEAKLAEYEIILKNCVLITIPAKRDRTAVHLGATVLCGVAKEKDEFTIVGTLEANPIRGFVSNESPVGRALLGLKVGERAEVGALRPAVYEVLKISYTVLS